MRAFTVRSSKPRKSAATVRFTNCRGCVSGLVIRGSGRRLRDFRSSRTEVRTMSRARSSRLIAISTLRLTLRLRPAVGVARAPALREVLAPPEPLVLLAIQARHHLAAALWTAHVLRLHLASP